MRPVLFFLSFELLAGRFKFSSDWWCQSSFCRENLNVLLTHGAKVELQFVHVYRYMSTVLSFNHDDLHQQSTFRPCIKPASTLGDPKLTYHQLSLSLPSDSTSMHLSRTPPPALAGPLVEIHDARNPTQLLGISFVVDSIGPEEQARIKRPLLPDGELLLYHQLWRALLRGSEPSSRPALPVELIRLIVRAAALMVPDRQQTHHAKQCVFVRVKTYDEEPVVSRVWFWTKPLHLADFAAAQLVTVSRDQGWCAPLTDVCHSWFEWGVFNRGIPAEEEVGFGRKHGAFTGDEKAWATRKAGQNVWRRSHGNPVANSLYQQHDGKQVGIEDEMWDNATEGSIIAVRACAQQALWENDARYGEILVWKWFEPVV
ncbi:hypothetical protein MVEN_00371700 [Mycena venus]|uniref:Uncharacterized protein n=1 Tax=Mycena venus TaxID=2733690 RepID=A0A8H7DAW6_9AGAR|nr:hypothetical protein MVEN_00371700 [Mycena venus]